MNVQRTFHTISVLVENRSGVLARVSALFSRRGYNIESLSVGPTQDPQFSRITIVVSVEGHALDQVIQQLDKLVNVIAIEEMHESSSVQIELLLVRVSVTAANQEKLRTLVAEHGGKMAEMGSTSAIVSLTDTSTKIEALVNALNPFGILELTQSGLVAMRRTI
ncbi:MAG: acetolactate synthase small subunit [Candidatus Nanopelagicaceae bacterium]|nr:acetolactate synthase small subunit [Candidatus Nanopelagicaceae bacterium]